MKSNKQKAKKIIYIILLTVLAIVFVASLTFGTIAAFFTTAKESIEDWYLASFDKEIALFKVSIIGLISSCILLIFTLSYKDIKRKYLN